MGTGKPCLEVLTTLLKTNDSSFAASRPRSSPLSGCGEIAVAIPESVKTTPKLPARAANLAPKAAFAPAVALKQLRA